MKLVPTLPVAPANRQQSQIWLLYTQTNKKIPKKQSPCLTEQDTMKLTLDFQGPNNINPCDFNDYITLHFRYLNICSVSHSLLFKPKRWTHSSMFPVLLWGHSSPCFNWVDVLNVPTETCRSRIIFACFFTIFGTLSHYYTTNCTVILIHCF